jgi:hypothetical protein
VGESGRRAGVVTLNVDPHFQRRERVAALAVAAGFREKAFFEAI